jgi:hypothetical protein
MLVLEFFGVFWFDLGRVFWFGLGEGRSGLFRLIFVELFEAEDA